MRIVSICASSSPIVKVFLEGETYFAVHDNQEDAWYETITQHQLQDKYDIFVLFNTELKTPFDYQQYLKQLNDCLWATDSARNILIIKQVLVEKIVEHGSFSILEQYPFDTLEYISHQLRLPVAKFDWRAYVLKYKDLWNANIRTAEAAYNHYQKYGINEHRNCQLARIPGSFYLVDLNIHAYCGLFNQLNILVNSIILAHYAGRDVAVNWFYPNYRSRTQYPIEKVIDIPELNSRIREYGLEPYVGTLKNTKQIQSSRLSGGFYNCNELEIFKVHQEQPSSSIRLECGDSAIFYRNVDPFLSDLYFSLIAHIPFTDHIKQTVHQIKCSFNLNNYHAVHLRLEDDMLNFKQIREPNNINFVSKTHNTYLETMRLLFNTNDQIFIATDLGKNAHKCNWILDEIKNLYPNAITSENWRDSHPDFPTGREFDAIVDYLLCQGAESFIGFGSSTFSDTLLNYFEYQKKTHLDINKFIAGDIFTILQGTIHHGNLGLNGDLRHTVDYNGKEISKIPIDLNASTISAHAPCKLDIMLHHSVNLEGYCSPTAKEAPTMQFWCNDQLLGTLNKADTYTDSLKLSPGKYTLKVTSNSGYWAHSIWILKQDC